MRKNKTKNVRACGHLLRSTYVFPVVGGQGNAGEWAWQHAKERSGEGVRVWTGRRKRKKKNFRQLTLFHFHFFSNHAHPKMLALRAAAAAALRSASVASPSGLVRRVAVASSSGRAYHKNVR
jgi:hypothetical protein